MTASALQPGCLACGLCQTWPIGNDFQIEARWDNQGNLIRHLQSDIYKKLLLLMELSVTCPVVEFLTVLEFRGLDMVEEART